jgi:hypothetical protein
LACLGVELSSDRVGLLPVPCGQRVIERREGNRLCLNRANSQAAQDNSYGDAFNPMHHSPATRTQTTKSGALARRDKA